MYSFKPLTLDDKEKIDSHVIKLPFYQDYLSSELVFENLLAWQQNDCILIMWKDDVGYIKCEKNQEVWMFPPIAGSEKDFVKGIHFIIHRFPHARIIGLTEAMKNIIPFDLVFLKDDKLSEYIYDTQAFMEMKGSKYHRKRNLIAQFKKQYNYKLTQAIHDDMGEIDLFLIKYQRQGGAIEDFNPLYKTLDLYLKGAHYIVTLLWVDEAVVGLSIGTISLNQTGIFLFEKADTDYIGCYQMLAHLTTSTYYSTCRYISRQEDVGMPELRKAKLSYHPIMKDMKYAAYYRPFMKQAYDLYQESFQEDLKGYRDYFFLNHYDETNMRYVFEEGILKSLFYIKWNTYVINNKTFKVPMVVAAATHPDYRRQGLMKKLIQDFIEECTKKRIPWIILKTDQSYIYESQGFFPVGYQERVKDYESLEGCTIAQTANMKALLNLYETRFKDLAHDVRDIGYYQDMVYALSADGIEASLIMKDNETIGYVIEKDNLVEEMVLLKKVNPIIKGKDFSNVRIISDQGEPSHMMRICHAEAAISVFDQPQEDDFVFIVKDMLGPDQNLRYLMKKQGRYAENYEPKITISYQEVIDIFFHRKYHPILSERFIIPIMTFINQY